MCIANNSERYISFSLGTLRFIDSFQFLGTSLEKLVNNLAAEGKDKFKLLTRYVVDPTKQDLLLRKGVYPYDYVDSPAKLTETSLPPQAAFYSVLNQEEISAEDYAHAEKVWRVFRCRTISNFLLFGNIEIHAVHKVGLFRYCNSIAIHLQWTTAHLHLMEIRSAWLCCWSSRICCWFQLCIFLFKGKKFRLLAVCWRILASRYCIHVYFTEIGYALFSKPGTKWESLTWLGKCTRTQNSFTNIFAWMFKHFTSYCTSWNLW